MGAGTGVGVGIGAGVALLALGITNDTAGFGGAGETAGVRNACDMKASEGLGGAGGTGRVF